LRVIAGKWRSRPLRVPKGRTVRPTADRVREAVFDILGDRVAGAVVLDLFAGSGALGLEALSRGAKSAVLVESDPAAFAVLKKNAESLGAAEADALLMDYRRAVPLLRRRGLRFSLVFFDPPYAKGMAEGAAEAVGRAGLLLPGAAAVVEDAARAPEGRFPGDWSRSVSRRYGDTRVTVFTVPDRPSRDHNEADKESP
jgi:16S rRNA (guanine(966)-N(2))-methyltransferase RsmD